MERSAKNPVQSTKTTLSIVNKLEANDEMGVSELADRLDLTKGTVHNHLSTLEQYGYVVGEGGRYRLGMRFFEIGQTVVQRKQVREIARPELEDLAEKTGEMANLMIEEQGRGIYIDIARSDTAINIDTRVGTVQRLHTTALGKAILANLPEHRVERILDHPEMPKETANTVTDREKLLEELETVRNLGVAFDGEERAKGIRCVAAPLLTHEDDVIGAISVTGPARRMKPDRMHNEIAEAVKDTANVIQVNVSYV